MNFKEGSNINDFFMKPIKLKDLAKDYILKRIISERMLPGEKLNEKDIAKKLGISVTPVREAFIELATENIIKLERYKAPVLHALEKEEIVEVFDIREALESQAAKLASIKINEVQAKELKKTCDQYEAIVKDKGRAFFNSYFHSKIVEISANNKISAMLNIINLQIYILSEMCRSIPGTHSRSMDHNEIANAIINNKPEIARQLMAKHIETSKSILLSDLEANGYF